ncbi:MAG: primosomal protein N' [Candidatus Peregrinibacteria bacterium]
MNYFEVLIPQKVELLTYSSSSPLKVGQSVQIPLRNSTSHGIVWKKTKKPTFKTLPINSIHHKTPLLNKTQIDLLKWMSKYYFCPLSILLKLFIPKRILENRPFKAKTQPIEQIINSTPKELTTPQKSAIDTILSSNKNNFLIHGITGSGKTEIYTHLASSYIKKTQQVLILVPEISLTPQIIEYFEKSIGLPSSVIHSKLSEGERFKSWEDIWQSKAKLIIGSRSAIFAPFQNLGLIIIDEEHELSYKQDSSPRYTVHKVAEKLQNLNPKLKIVFGSATPSIETAERLKDSTITIKERIGDSVLPDIEIVDLREEFQKGNYSIFSDRLHEELTKILENKDQAILFLNRRGSASSMVCRDCGEAVECQNCELKMTYHAKTLSNPSLICHHCGKIIPPPNTCPNCQGPNIKFLGIGTQRIETDLKKEFPTARVLRADKDTTTKKNSFKEIYKAFKNHEADILVGTQMIAKGLHLPKVNLVGVILADIGLNIPDFRTAERNFQLMTQVSGRAGRSKTKGKVIIQTYSPDNVALTFTQTNDYQNFFKYERTQRSLLKNPPFSTLAKIQIEDKSLDTCKQKALILENHLWKSARELNLTENLEILNYPSYILRLRNKYRYIILIKDTSISYTPHKILENLPKEDIMDPNIKIDVDPISIT